MLSGVLLAGAVGWITVVGNGLTVGASNGVGEGVGVGSSGLGVGVGDVAPGVGVMPRVGVGSAQPLVWVPEIKYSL